MQLCLKVIKNRPKRHLQRPDYGLLVPGPYNVAMNLVPDLVKLSLLNLDGVQPITQGRCVAAKGFTSTQISGDEIKYYRDRDARFQLIMIVTNCIQVGVESGAPLLLPYSMTLLPSSKRGEVAESNEDFVSQFSGAPLMGGDTAYVGFDPFAGDWQLWGNAGVVVGESPRAGFMDELGLVYDHYFLEIDYDSEGLAYFFPDIPDVVKQRYAKHISKLMFKPFREVRARRLWGLETAIELFVLQEILYRGLPPPTPQVMIMEDGTNFPCLYDAWNSFSEDSSSDLISEVDFFFPEQGIVLFCDGAQHSRQRNRDRDSKIDKKLDRLGYRAVRISSKRILEDVSGAVDQLTDMISTC